MDIDDVPRSCFLGKLVNRLVKRLYLFRLAFTMDPAQAIAGVVWHIRGKIVRGRNLIWQSASAHPGYYAYWIRYVESAFRSHAESQHDEDAFCPIIVLVLSTLDTSCEQQYLSLASIDAAFGPGARRHIVSYGAAGQAGAPTLGQALQLGFEVEQGRYILPLFAGDELDPVAGRILRGAIALSDQAPVVYWDEDRLDLSGRRADPWLKPDWDPLQFLAQDYLSGASMVRTDIAAALVSQGAQLGEWGLDKLTAMAVRTAGERQPYHVEHILAHRRSAALDARTCDRGELVTRLLDEQMETTERAEGLIQINWPLPLSSPSVSILVPMRDRVELLRICMAGLQRIEYPGDIEIIIIDNDSREPDACAYLDELAQSGVRVLRQPGPFNYAAINNHGVGQARGEYICLLNNDIEMVNGDWLALMMRHAIRPGVAAVGAKLLYPDGTIQHAGVAVGLGQAAGHLHRHVPDGSPGYFHQPHIARHVTAVTAACLLVQRAKFIAVGGLDAEHFPVAFNDVDLCLKFVREGWHNVYCPEAVLIHHESKSRGSDTAIENRDRFSRELTNLKRIWATETFKDPYLNSRFSRRSEGLYLELAP